MERPQRIAPAGTLSYGSITASDETRYPGLFLTDREHGPGFSRTVRTGTGLVIVTARNDALTSEERQAIATYRLHQYALAGLYDADVVERLGLREDPAMSTLADADVHVAAGDCEGRFLCYVSMQSPLAPGPEYAGRTHLCPGEPVLGDADRQIFPCESEYGTRIYGDHPWLAKLPVARVRELTRLVRNQAVQTLVDSLTVVEVLVAMFAVVTDSSHEIDALIGCIAPEARRVVYYLGFPTVYAPHASIIGDNLGGTAASRQLLWTPQASKPGRFWPFAVAVRDLVRESEYVAKLAEALSLPRDEAVTGVKRLRRSGPPIPPSLLVDESHAGGTFWTDNPA